VPAADGQPTTITFNHVTVWKTDDDGRWRGGRRQRQPDRSAAGSAVPIRTLTVSGQAAAPGAARHIDLFCRAFAIKLYELQVARSGGYPRRARKG